MRNIDPHPLYRLLRRLEEGSFPFRLDRHRDDTVLVSVTLVGGRLEIDVFEDGHLEFARFVGDESVDSDPARIDEILWIGIGEKR
ncbi:hypothetical protein [Methylopila sp. 73B]|uniref:hypothetical protein n=1 Tax=Methylopila sp. 73B TaxID=1120792 RepID=UPI0003615A7F|nr:hypothetical protein [Methylopila sp. 73B]